MKNVTLPHTFVGWETGRQIQLNFNRCSHMNWINCGYGVECKVVMFMYITASSIGKGEKGFWFMRKS